MYVSIDVQLMQTLSHFLQIITGLTLSLDPLRLLFVTAILACSVPAYGLLSSCLCPIIIALLAYIIPLPAVLGLAFAVGHSMAAAKKFINSRGLCL